MSMLETHFTPEELAPFRSNFRKFIRLTALSQDPLQQKWVSDETDLAETLECVTIMFHGTQNMIGKRKHKGIDFNFCDDVKQDMSELLFGGENEVKIRLRRKRHVPLYYLIVDPAVDLMSKFDHVTTISLVDDVMKQLTNMLYTTDNYGTYDDALIAATQVKQLAQQREEQQKIERSKRKRKRKPVEHEMIDEPADI